MSNFIFHNACLSLTFKFASPSAIMSRSQSPLTQVLSTDEDDIPLAQATPVSDSDTQSQRCPEGYTYTQPSSILRPTPKSVRMRAPPMIDTAVESPTKKHKITPMSACRSPTHVGYKYNKKSPPKMPKRPLRQKSPRWVEWLHYHLYPTTAYHPRAYSHFPELTEDGHPRDDYYAQGHGVLCDGCRNYKNSIGIVSELLYAATQSLQGIVQHANRLAARTQTLEAEVQRLSGQMQSETQLRITWEQVADAQREQLMSITDHMRYRCIQARDPSPPPFECPSDAYRMNNREREIMALEDVRLFG